MAVCITVKKSSCPSRLGFSNLKRAGTYSKKADTGVLKCRNSAAAEQKRNKSYTLVVKVQLWP